MSRFSVLFLALLSAYTPLLAQQVTNTTGKVSEVTVFTQGALVTQTASFDLKSGENRVRMTNIPSSVDLNSFQVSGGKDFDITGIRHEVNYAGSGLNPLGRAKKDSLETARFSLQTKEALRKAYYEELLMLQANRSVGGKNNVLLAEDLEEMADFFRERVKQINYKTLEINEEERELNALIARLENELRDLRALGNKNNREVIVSLIGKRSGKAELSLTYFAHNASWSVLYDLRSAETGADLELVTKARVRQSTGVDWSNVKLALSTGTPSVGGAPPVLFPWKLYVNDPAEVNARISDREGFARAKGAPMMDEVYELEEVSAATMKVTENRQQLSTVFDVSLPYSISGDNREHEVEVRRQNIPATYRHRAVPKMTRDVYLTAEITDWDQYNLLPGETAVYFEGNFVGRSFLNPAVATDTLSLSMGRDPNISVTYDQIKDFSKTSTFGGKRRTTRGYHIKVMNTGIKEINLRIEDQLPISTTGDIEVEAEELSGGQLDATTGKVTWNVSVLPGRLSEQILKYRVTYPKKKVIQGL